MFKKSTAKEVEIPPSLPHGGFGFESGDSEREFSPRPSHLVRNDKYGGAKNSKEEIRYVV